MPKKLAIFLSGTGGTDQLKKYAEDTFEEEFTNQVIRIYIKGCQHKNVGNGYLHPDLGIAANNFEGVFTEKNVIDLNKLQQNFGDGIAGIVGSHENPIIDVDSILIFGHSRGGVTAFLLARKLQQLNNSRNIPVYIMADQPVPGDRISNPSRNLKEALNCTECNNIKQVYVLLGSYQPTNFIHDTWFPQMVPSFSEDTDAMVLELPIDNHFSSTKRITSCYLQLFMHRLDMISGHRDPIFQLIENYYSRHVPYYYALPNENQPIFGKNTTKRYRDSLYYSSCYKELFTLYSNKEILNSLRFYNLLWFDLLCYTLKSLQAVYKAELNKIIEIESLGEKILEVEEKSQQFLTTVIGSIIEYIKGDNIDLRLQVTETTKQLGIKKALKIPENPNFEVFRYWLANIAFYLLTGIFGALAFHTVTWLYYGKQNMIFFPFFAESTRKIFAFNRICQTTQSVVEKCIRFKSTNPEPVSFHKSNDTTHKTYRRLATAHRLFRPKCTRKTITGAQDYMIAPCAS